MCHGRTSTNGSPKAELPPKLKLSSSLFSKVAIKHEYHQSSKLRKHSITFQARARETTKNWTKHITCTLRKSIKLSTAMATRAAPWMTSLPGTRRGLIFTSALSSLSQLARGSRAITQGLEATQTKKRFDQWLTAAGRT